MLAWNQTLFLWLNASGHPDRAAVLAAEFFAQALVYVALAIIVALWVWGPPARRGALLATVVAAALALGLNQLLGLIWFEPRPFMAGIGHTLMAHVPENSFPSDHATLIWALGASLVATDASVTAGFVLGALGLLIAWARIYLGLHFPIDMMTSALVAVCAAVFARASIGPIDAMVRPVVERIYEWTLGILRLPPTWFPRS